MRRWSKPAVTNPAHYAQGVLLQCDLKEPPIPVEPILHHLKLNLKEFSSQDFPTEKHQPLKEFTKEACAWKSHSNGQTTIWVLKDSIASRKRLNIFHECGHEILPWHDDVDYFCSEADLSPETRKLIEKEAFACGTELLMPYEFFYEDIQSLGIGISAIEQLGNRYEASLEATAIRYAGLHTGACAVVIMEPLKNQDGDGIPRTTAIPQLGLEFCTTTVEQPKETCSLVVKYCVPSRSFPSYVQPRTSIREDNVIYSAWLAGRQIRDVIPASALGSSQQLIYQVECLPLGYSGKVLVLLWIPTDKQETLF